MLILLPEKNSMKERPMRLMTALTTCAAILISTAAVSRVLAQETSAPAYLNPTLPPEVRATDLVHRMTLEEKASQLVNQARAIPRLRSLRTTGGVRRCTALPSNDTDRVPGADQISPQPSIRRCSPRWVPISVPRHVLCMTRP